MCRRGSRQGASPRKWVYTHPQALLPLEKESPSPLMELETEEQASISVLVSHREQVMQFMSVFFMCVCVCVTAHRQTSRCSHAWLGSAVSTTLTARTDGKDLPHEETLRHTHPDVMRHTRPSLAPTDLSLNPTMSHVKHPLPPSVFICVNLAGGMLW